MRISKVTNLFVGIFQKVEQNYYQITRESFNITPEWFDEIYAKHYTTDIKSKFDSNLFVDQGIGEDIVEFIVNPDIYNTQLQGELRILHDWVVDFSGYYKELKVLLFNQNIRINKNSRQYRQLEVLNYKSHQF